MSYTPEVNSARIADGTVAFVDLAPALQAMLGSLPVGAGIDFEGFTLPTGWLWEDGAQVNRVTYATLLTAITLTQNGTRNATINITGLTSTKDIRVGCPVEGTGMPTGVTVASIVSATAITLSVAATGSGTDPIRFFPHGNGNGTTTFNTPDARGRASVGMDNLGGNGDAGNLDAAQVGIGRTLGAQTYALTPAETPLRSHTHSGTTATQSADHSHSGTTGTVSSDHAHTVLGEQFNNNVNGTATSAQRSNSVGSFSQSNSVSGISANHTHAVTTGGVSANHTHTITTGTPSVAEANGAAHQNMQPSRLVNRIVYAGA